MHWRDTEAANRIWRNGLFTGLAIGACVALLLAMAAWPTLPY